MIEEDAGTSDDTNQPADPGQDTAPASGDPVSSTPPVTEPTSGEATSEAEDDDDDDPDEDDDEDEDDEDGDDDSDSVSGGEAA